MKRMYILVRESIPHGIAVNSACHAAVAATLKWQETDEVQEWLKDSFRKVTCVVNDKEFEKAKEAGDWVEITELALDKEVVALAFKPRDEYPKNFKWYRLVK
jgi:peptidyl-tRNA hydrolase